jgi:hypothetical protein
MKREEEKGQETTYTEGERKEERKRGKIERKDRVEREKEGRDREEGHMSIDGGKETRGKRQRDGV